MMQLFYTPISTDLTELLTQKANQYITEGKRVFYIAPNSLSFEKERKVLEYLPQKATFQMLVTRFGQIPNYFILPKKEEGEGLDDSGLSMLLYRVLRQLPDQKLPVFGRVQNDPGFIEQLLDLYKEFAKSQLSLDDLDVLVDKNSPLDKVSELKMILGAFLGELDKEELASDSKLQFFLRSLSGDALDDQLKDVVFIIDGFTRFSEEEERLIEHLHPKAADIIIGTYASEKAYQAHMLSGNVYEASVSFLRDLAVQYGVKPSPLGGAKDTLFSRVSTAFEQSYTFLAEDKHPAWTKAEKEALQIWEAPNQKNEIEAVARDIRRKMREEGADYKDFLLLLGDESSYQLPLARIFAQFDIPFYWGRSEAMVNHPLAHFLMTLERVVTYYFQRDDVLNLIKSGLFGKFSQRDVDVFEDYCHFADISGKHFQKPFKHNSHQHVREAHGETMEIAKYDLARLNQLRKQIISPLLKLMADQDDRDLFGALMTFFGDIDLVSNFKHLVRDTTVQELEQHEQVWKSFVSLLEQARRIFNKHEMSMPELITLLSDGLKSSHYRTIPATVNVVKVRSYDLIAPHSSPYVYAIGLTQAHFPKIVQNNSLLSDADRHIINERTTSTGRLEIVTSDNLKKNHFVAISLLNAAEKGLVLSYPQLIGESQDTVSPYLKRLVEQLGLPLTKKQRSLQTIEPDDLGSYKEVLARLVVLNRSQLLDRLSPEEVTYWSVLGRVISKELATNGIKRTAISKEVSSRPLSQDVLEVLFPPEKPVSLSASSLARFYNNQYLYFVEKVLGLQQQESIHPDARSHGNFLHKVFERALANQEVGSFDDKLEAALRETREDPTFNAIYTKDQGSLYSRELLEGIARATGSLFGHNDHIRVSRQEAPFQLSLAGSSHPLKNREIVVTGIIDRVDQLYTGDQPVAYGVIDYKSSHQRFRLDDFYNGLSPQLMTYLLALQEGKDRQGNTLFPRLDYFGAMYLQMQEPSVTLKELSAFGKLPQKIKEELRYDGLFREEFLDFLPQQDYKYSRNRQAVVYDEAELATLIAFVKWQYQQAAEAIVRGEFAINPYTRDGKTVSGEQLNALTGFEADLHLGQSRRLETLTANPSQKRQLIMNKIQETVNENGGDFRV
ncbi:ATP-dependent nuclease subunit B [Streptococcus hyovaginalis]|uniref:ATP-dependent nuclease subunit B n=1 Tax=Streptococcus hyovaginalis TaxID=149015 RepID=UPI003BF781F9